jgi:hypothetical protein
VAGFPARIASKTSWTGVVIQYPIGGRTELQEG